MCGISNTKNDTNCVNTEISPPIHNSFNDVLTDDNALRLEAFNLNSKVSGDILLLNCSRDEIKLKKAKKLIKEKNLNYFPLDIWE